MSTTRDDNLDRILDRITQHAGQFQRVWRYDWSELKQRNDFPEIYSLPPKERAPLENIYAEGRQLAFDLKDLLPQYQDRQRFPTLKSYVDFLADTKIYATQALRSQSQTARARAATTPNVPWVIHPMIALFEQQIVWMEDLRALIDALKETETYKWEDSGYTGKPAPSADQVIEVIEHTGKMFESSPASYGTMQEGDFRNHILASLNGSFPGQVSGETFNNVGKTDILVRKRGSGGNELIAECKIWRGSNSVAPAVSQLLSYLTWRDTRAALIFFVHGKNMLWTTIKEEVAKHPNYNSIAPDRSNSWAEFLFSSPNVEGGFVRLAVLAYHVPH